jgi:DNA-binding transcriptional LysR family regulator
MERSDFSSDDLLLFTAIVERASLVRAAEHLDMPKATVSRRLANLEARLGQKLLVRTTRRLALTEFGQGFFEHCQRVTEEVEAARDFVRSQEAQPRGRLRVSVPADYARYVLSGAIATFVEQYPTIELELDLTPRRVDLIGERFDLAIRMGELESDATLVARKLADERQALYASPIYLAVRPAPGHPDDLARHRAVRMLAADGTPARWRLTRGDTVWEGVAPGNLSLNSPGVIQHLVMDGAGIGALPERFAAEEVALKRLVRVLPEWSLPSVPAWAVMPTRRYLPAKTRALLTHLELCLGQGR